ncbi:response regulator [Cryobacterium luteum]|uniref:histidine kinase n=1 Tax=Cryobacterium luteum TaxID=1424661 RepID=A0A1H8D1F6_9MICO|nr:response regulator [Cryobacterium luteum]TFB91861.1 response regulator [Cryobacterium luteum]SEN01055.1 PAS domain S-box-containing protein [Cryobacterium luteum]
MNGFHPPDDTDTRFEDSSEATAARSANLNDADAPSLSLSVEVLNRRLHDLQFYTRSLIESNIDSLMTTDTTGIITDVNQQMVDLTGRTRDELIGAPCRNFFTNPARADTAIARVLTEDRLSDYELTVRAFDGTETVVSCNAATLRDRERTVRGVVAAARDVTESKKFERALLEKIFKLEQANISLSEDLERAKVDLLTPLQAVVESSEALRSGNDGDLNTTQQERIEKISSHGKHLLSLLSELIGMSTVETGLVDFDFHNVDVFGLLSATAAAVNHSGEPQVSVSVDVSDGVGLFPLDATNVEQMLAVLVANALAAGSDTPVILSAQTVEPGMVGEFEGVRPHWSFPLPAGDYVDYLQIRVEDHGVGIAAEDLPTVFLPLRNGMSDAGWKSSGDGVGLAKVKLLIELQGGTLGVQGAPGDGATFAIWLPRRILGAASNGAAGEEAARPTLETRLDAGQPTVGELHVSSGAPQEPHDENSDALVEHASPDLVGAADADSDVDVQSLGEAVADLDAETERSIALVVEDDQKSAKLVRLLLEAEGFQVIAAPSGEEALELVHRTAVSLITLDVRLPGMDGWKFLMKLHDSPDWASVPVVVIAGLADMSLALSRGAAAVLEKPLQRAELQKSLALLGFRPDDARTRCILVVDEDWETIQRVDSYLELPVYRVKSALTGEAAITDALSLKPDLILINLMMEDFSGFKIVRALQEHTATQHIPVLVMSSSQLTGEDQAAINSDPGQPVLAMDRPDFNREVLLAEVKRALRGADVQNHPASGRAGDSME